MSYTFANIEFSSVPLMLAPLEDVTDSSFRLLCKSFGADVVFTEFVSSEGLVRDAVKSFRKLDFDQRERPLGVQIFGSDIEAMRRSAIIAQEANPEFIDLNFGCPVKKVVDKGGGAALLKDLEKMQKLASAVVKAVNLPVTAKTRLGWDENSKNIMEAAIRLQDAGIAGLSIHGRTRNQLYGGKADWTLIGEVKNNPEIHIPIIGNGDIDSPAKAAECIQKYGVDGLMIGRAAIGNPWIFNQCREFLNEGKEAELPGVNERVVVCRKHIQMALKLKGESRGIKEMRKHYTNYFKGLHAIKIYRNRLVTAPGLQEVEEILEEILSNYQL